MAEVVAVPSLHARPDSLSTQEFHLVDANQIAATADWILVSSAINLQESMVIVAARDVLTVS